MLAVGTAKGNLLLYSSRERRKMPVVGKATKRIVAAVWNRDGRLALASADKTVSRMQQQQQLAWAIAML